MENVKPTNDEENINISSNAVTHNLLEQSKTKQPHLNSGSLDNGMDVLPGTSKEPLPGMPEEKVYFYNGKKIEKLHERCRKVREKLADNMRRIEKKQKTVTINASKSSNGELLDNHIRNCDSDLNKTPQTNKSTVNNSSQMSRRELLNVVEGMQQLLLNITINNESLQKEVVKMAKKIPQLRNVPLFGQFLHTMPSTSAGISTRQQELPNDSQASNVGEKNTVTKSTNGERQTKRHKKSNKKKEATQATEEEALIKYINDIIYEYLGEHQKEKFEVLKLTQNHLMDMEAYAQTLVEVGLGRIVEEEIRINRKNNRQAFVALSTDRETTERDGFILLPIARRYAFEGDIVRAFVLNPGNDDSQQTTKVKADQTNSKRQRKSSGCIMGGQENSFSLAEGEELFDDTESSPDTELEDIGDLLDATTATVTDNCPKAFVIKIIQQAPMRQIVGTINFKAVTSLPNDKSYYKLRPHDMRVPIMYVPVESCTNIVTTENKSEIGGYLYLAQVLEIDANGRCIGELLQPVGKVGVLEAEIKAVLLQNGFKNLKAYEQKYEDMYSGPMPAIDEEMLKGREDLRKKCIFTIDPLTARDLDDALSIERIGDDEFEVGVHISDVSHYLLENSDLDNLVKERATSIYMVTEVIHMLPQSLCFKCSLLPGEDKFAFSVFWQMNSQAELLDKPRLARSVINSCSQFAYEHAQKIIDNPQEDFNVDDFPEIYNNWTPADIKWRVLALHKLAQNLKCKRYENGAISINNPKLRFTLDPILGEPLSFEVDSRHEANFLIEEFMLLANQSVAKFIHHHFPDKSILRNHAPPLMKSIKALRDRLLALGLDFDISSSKAIYASMGRLCREAADPKAMDACLNTLLTKPMARARYFCSEGKTEADFWHYALSVPIYTHFTSPIRRYPDILVHRLVAAALNCGPIPKRSSDELHQLVKVCNEQKLNAKNVNDDSINLFFKRYIKANQPVVLKAVVTDIFQHLMNVVTIETGHSIAISYKMQKVLVNTTRVPTCVVISEKNSTKPPIKLEIFSTLDIKLVIFDNRLCGFIASPDPKQRYLNRVESPSMKRDKQYYASCANGDDQQMRNRHNPSTSENENVNNNNNNNVPTDNAMSEKKKKKRKKQNKNIQLPACE